jgi:dihydrofolate synthase / folylpolyglutamate synthase
MAEEARKFDKEVYLEEDIARAVDLALSLQREGDLVCVTGSLYMIAEARAYLLGIE